MASGLPTQQPQLFRPKIEFYKRIGNQSIIQELKSPPKIVGNLGGRCIVVQNQNRAYFVDLSGIVFCPEGEFFSGSITFENHLGHSIGTYRRWAKLEGTTTEGLVYLESSRLLVAQPLLEKDRVLATVTDQVVLMTKDESYSLALFHKDLAGKPLAFRQEIFTPNEGTWHSHFCSNDALFVVAGKGSGLCLEEFKIKHVENGGRQSFEAKHSSSTILAQPERVIPIASSFLWLSKQNFVTGVLQEQSVVTLFSRNKEDKLITQTFLPDPRIPFASLIPLGSSKGELFYKAGEQVNEWGLCVFFENGECNLSLIVRNALAAAVSFVSEYQHLAFLEKLSDNSRLLKVHERKEAEIFLVEPTYKIAIDGTPNTLTFLKPGYLAVGFDDEAQKRCFVYQLQDGEVKTAYLDVEAGDSHIISGHRGLFHWLGQKIEKDEEGTPTLSRKLFTQHVDRLFPKEEKAEEVQKKKLGRKELRRLKRELNKTPRKSGAPLV
jgi:hypothetical protein